MPKIKPSHLFSAQSRAALHIDDTYYKGKHYFICSPDIGYPINDFSSPDSSIPINKYNSLRTAAEQGDLRHPVISSNISGLLTGVDAQLKKGMISKEEALEIQELISKLQPKHFDPVMCIMPVNEETEKYLTVYHYEADVLSEEYRFEDLPDSWVKREKFEKNIK